MTHSDLRERVARAIVAEFPARSQPDNDDYAEALRYADAALKVLPRPKCGGIVAAFPATGKTWFALSRPLSVVDSDSSLFSHRPGWPDAYLDHIAAQVADGATVLVSTHAEVRRSLANAGQFFTLVYPDRRLREEYRVRMVTRGSSAALVEAVCDHWYEWLDDCAAQRHCDHIVLKSGEYLADALGEGK